MKNLVLIGMMGSAKTTTGKIIARELNVPFFDGDAVYEDKYGEKISETFEKHGEEVFRQREREVYKILGDLDGSVIACGGGVVLSEENMTALKRNGVIVLLTATPEAIYKRVSKNPNRPLVREGGLEKINKIMSERDHLYKKHSNFTVDNTHLSPKASAQRVISLYNKMK